MSVDDSEVSLRSAAIGPASGTEIGCIGSSACVALTGAGFSSSSSELSFAESEESKSDESDGGCVGRRLGFQLA